VAQSDRQADDQPVVDRGVSACKDHRMRYARSASVIAIIAMLTAAGGCGGIRIAARSEPVRADDGATLAAFKLNIVGLGQRPQRGWLFYVQGSEPRTVTDRIGELAGAAALGLQLVLVERRGVMPDRPVDEQVFHESSGKSTRVADHLAVIRHFLTDAAAGQVVVLMGESEGGEVAAAVALAEPRVTQLILIGCGGAWTQAQEFEHFLAKGGTYLDVNSIADLHARFDDIRANPDAMTMWAGHPYRRWSSYLWDSPADDVLALDIPIFLAQGDADSSVPVESARALAQAFIESGKANLRYLEYAGVDHSMRELATGRSVLPRLEIDVLRWLGDEGVMDHAELVGAEKRIRAAHPECFGSATTAPPSAAR
jgi:pimeloyl-ACP methyl ester carboxylesterase